MFILDSEKQIERAIVKARQSKPLVKQIEFGQYAVKGSKGTYYKVKCERTAKGEKLVSCECKGGKRGLVCYHAVACLGLHIVLASRQNAIA